uniref:Spermatogenesis associated 2 like n=1 Tax=Kryptolebias marmoratus TaxID=37003 RepID=A0A3Q3BQ66_KRYMA
MLDSLRPGLALQRARELVRMYDHILEQQIVGRGCSLACRDETLWKQVEDRLKDTDALEMHCLGVNALREMEEARGGLRGLAKTFEVLEQAALNLYLGPWREEYRVIKMYSGTFTHFITPVLSMPQIEKLFGLLGYQPSPFRPEQLCLQPPKVSPSSLEDLLRLSCAFFVARCECHLLLSALGNHVGDAQWELNMVRERQRGNSLQVRLCINGLHPVLKHCFDCDTLHEVTCTILGDCTMKGHKVQFADNLPEKMREAHETSPPSGIFRESATNNPTSINAAMSSSDVGDDTKPANLHPISYHACCDLRVAKQDPRILCHKCLVFHSHLCVEGKLCRVSHEISELGMCSCGKVCARKPLVLCRYCGREYCSACWYRQPVTCICGQTFDQESSV